MLTAEPFAAINLPNEALIGEALDLSVTFDNVSTTDTGFGPYVDLILPATGPTARGRRSTTASPSSRRPTSDRPSPRRS